MPEIINLDVRGTIVKVGYYDVFHSSKGCLYPLQKYVQKAPGETGKNLYAVNLDPAAFCRLTDYLQYKGSLFEGLSRSEAIAVSAMVEDLGLCLPGVQWDPGHCGLNFVLSDECRCAAIAISGLPNEHVFSQRLLAVQPLPTFKIRVDLCCFDATLTMACGLHLGFASRLGCAEYVIALESSAARCARICEDITVTLDQAKQQVTMTSETCGTKSCSYGVIATGALYPCLVYRPLYAKHTVHFQARLLAD